MRKQKLNKEKFLKTEFGSNLMGMRDRLGSLDTGLGQIYTECNGREYKEAQKAANWCQAQWEVYQLAMKQFYGIEYCFNRTDEYFGVYTEDETDYLFEIERKE